MLRDRALKASALRLCVSKRWLPQLEIDVEARTRTERSKYLLTDIDVLAFAPDAITGLNRAIFDCKSGGKESPIGRAFWLRGLMDRMNVSHGFLLLSSNVNVSRDHRFGAADLNVSLIREHEFPEFSRALGGTSEHADAATAQVDLWERLFELGTQYPMIRPYLDFSRSPFWMIRDAGEQCRKTISRLRAIKTELDPAKREHLAIFADALCLFVLGLSQVTQRIFLSFLHPTSKDEFSNALLAMIYGGYENLEAAMKLKQISSGSHDGETTSIFPEWKRLEYLSREMLEAPLQAHVASMLARECSLELLGRETTFSYAVTLASEAPYASKFCLLAAEYLGYAAKLQSEFREYFSTLFLGRLAGTGVPELPVRRAPGT